jgi:hypothetical protein
MGSYRRVGLGLWRRVNFLVTPHGLLVSFTFLYTLLAGSFSAQRTITDFASTPSSIENAYFGTTPIGILPYPRPATIPAIVSPIRAPRNDLRGRILT